MKPSLILSALFASAIVCSAQAVPDDMAALKASYEKARREAIAPLAVRYVDSLHTLKMKYTQAGDLEGALAVENQIKEAGAATIVGSSQMPEDLTALRRTYDEATTRATDPLARKYIEALEVMKVRYTQLNKLEQAVAVDKELKTIQAALPAKEASSQPILADMVTGTRWRLPRHVLPDTLENDKWVKFAANGVLECGWGPKTFVWRINEEGTINFRPFKNQNRLLVFKWDNASPNAIITDDGVDYEVSQKKGG